MRVSEVMTREVEWINPEASLEQAAERMRSLKLGALPIAENGNLLGMITDRDIVTRSVAGGHDPQIDRVCDVMSPGILYCFEDQDVADAAELMKRTQVRRLMVFSRGDLLVGIVSLADLALKTGDERMVGSALLGISEQSAERVACSTATEGSSGVAQLGP
jgi:CBS domain-containing protein